MKKNSGKGAWSRRDFARTAIATTAIAMIPSSVAAVSYQAGEPKDSGEAKLPAEARAELEAKYQNILRKYGDRLNDDQRKRMRQILVYDMNMLIPVRAFKLENGDSPATVLKLSSGAAKAQKSTAAKAGGKN